MPFASLPALGLGFVFTCPCFPGVLSPVVADVFSIVNGVPMMRLLLFLGIPLIFVSKFVFMLFRFCFMVAFVGSTELLILARFCFLSSVFIDFYPVGKVGFDSPAKLVGRPRMRVPPYLGGSHEYFSLFPPLF